MVLVDAFKVGNETLAGFSNEREIDLILSPSAEVTSVKAVVLILLIPVEEVLGIDPVGVARGDNLGKSLEEARVGLEEVLSYLFKVLLEALLLDSKVFRFSLLLVYCRS